MTRALLVGDVHLTDDIKRPTSRKAGYKDQILTKLRFCVEKANELDVPIVQLGDMFHLKHSSKTSHALVQETHEVLKDARNDVWVVPGNHDMVYDRLDLLDRQPLGALCRMEGVHLLVGEDKRLPGIAGVPFITQFDGGGGWQRQLKDIWEDFNIDTPELLVTHAPIFPDGQQPKHYYSIAASDWADYFIGIPSTAYGHIHTPTEKYFDKDKIMQFANYGALSRGSLHEEAINRQIAVSLWTGGDFVRIEVPHLPPEEVFLFNEAAKKAANRASANEFSNLVGTVTLPYLTMEHVKASIREKASPEAFAVVEQILEGS